MEQPTVTSSSRATEWGATIAVGGLVFVPLLSFLGFIVWFLISMYGLPGLPGLPHLPADSVDFGNCHTISDGVGGALNSCTYKDGHTEILKLSETTDR